MAVTEGAPLPAAAIWRTPLLILVCGCLIGMLTFGPRSTFGFFMQPMSREFSWGRDVFGLALAIQNLLWGIGQPICRRDRRPVRQPARDLGRRAVVRRRPDHDALCGHAVLARHLRRRADRPRTVGLLVQSGAVGVRQADAAAMARRGARRRHRGRLVRAIRVCPVRRRHAGRFRLAAGPDRVRRPDAAGAAVVAGAGDAAIGFRRGRGRKHSRAFGMRWPRRSAIAPMCCWCSGSLPADSSSPSSPCICRPIWSTAACRCRPAAG